MSTGIDYAQWWIQLDDRRKVLQGELAEVSKLMDALRPLAERTGGVPQQQYTTTPTQPWIVREGGAPYDATRQTNTTPEPEPEPATAPKGIYANMSSLAAALHYMRRAGGIRSTPEIADALREGGFPSSSPNFKVNMYTTMKRLAMRGRVVQLGEGKWRLARPGEVPTVERVEAEYEIVDDDVEEGQQDLIR